MALDAKTTLLTSQGEVRTADSLKVGDQLMGPDSRPRKITKLRKIEAEVIEIIPHRGQVIICDSKQILTLFKPDYLEKPFTYLKEGKLRTKRKLLGYPTHLPLLVEDLLQSSIHKFGRRFLLYQVPIEYPHQEVPLAPYFLGLWLGDGHTNRPAITTADRPIVKYVYDTAKNLGLKVTVNGKPNNKASTYTIVRDFNNKCAYNGRANPLQSSLSLLGVLGDKHIPQSYLYNSRETRLAVLAGLVDSDGSLEGNVYHITQKSFKLAQQIMLLANSLGFRSVIFKIRKSIKSLNFIGEYYRISISGRIDQIPVKLARKRVDTISDKHNRLLKGFVFKRGDHHTKMVEIEVEGDGQFLLSDCTVLGGVKTYESIKSFETTFYSQRKWKKSYDALEKFVTDKQRLPRVKFAEEKSLCNWVWDNISLEKRGKLSNEQIQKLKSLGVDFNYRENLFFKRFNHLLKFREVFPTRWPVHGEQFPEGNLIGSWCKDKRKAYRRNKLDKWQINLLASIGFPFEVR